MNNNLIKILLNQKLVEYAFYEHREIISLYKNIKKKISMKCLETIIYYNGLL